MTAAEIKSKMIARLDQIINLKCCSENAEIVKKLYTEYLEFKAKYYKTNA